MDAELQNAIQKKASVAKPSAEKLAKMEADQAAKRAEAEKAAVESEKAAE